MATKVDKMVTGLYLKAPHGVLVSQGKKHSIVSAKHDTAICGEHIIISKQDGQGLAFGTATVGEPVTIPISDFNTHFDSHRVTPSECAKWWKDCTELYIYPITEFAAYTNPRPVEVLAGTQMLMGEVTFLDERKVAQEDAMPWKPSDAQGHTHAADTPEKQRQWSEIANSALAACLKDGKDRKECEASAIQQANAVVGKRKEVDDRALAVQQLCAQLGVKVTVLSESDEANAPASEARVSSCQNDTNPEDKPKDEDEEDTEEKGTATDNNLPDSAFLYVEPGSKDKEGKTEPRSKRHLPYKTADGSIDLPRLRNALSRLGQSNTGKGWLSADLRKRLIAKAERLLKSANKKELETIVALLSDLKATEPDQSTCTCPNCDAVVDKEEGVACRDVECPDCGSMMRGGGDEADDAAKSNSAVEALANMSTGSLVTVPEMPTTPVAQSAPVPEVPAPAPEAKVDAPVAEPVVMTETVVAPAAPVETPAPAPATPAEPTEPERSAAFNLISLLTRAKSAIADFLGLNKPEADTLPAFKVFTSKSGKSYIVLWTTNNYRDREGEIFSLKSLREYVSRKSTEPTKGEFWYAHTPGTKFGTIMWQDVVSDRFLVQVGTFDDTLVGNAFKTFFTKFPSTHKSIAPKGWGASHGYHYNPADRKDRVYDWFDTFESSVLPMHRAANIYNPQPIVIGGKQMDEKSSAELRAIGDEIGVDLTTLITKTAEQRKSELDATVDHKSTTVQTDAQPVASVEPAPVAASTESKERPAEPSTLTEAQVAQIAKAFGMDALSQKFNEVLDSLKKQQTEVAALTSELAELKQADAKRLEEKAQQLPNFESFSWLRPSQSTQTLLTSDDAKLKTAGPRVPPAIARLSEAE